MDIIDSSGNRINVLRGPTVTPKTQEILIRTSGDEGVVKSREGDLSLTRVSLKKLEVLSVRDSLLNSGVSIYVQKITGYGYDIFPGDDTPEAEANYDSIITFRDNLKRDLLFYLERQTDSSCRLGTGFLEIVFNKNRNLVLGLDDIDTKTLNYVEDNSGSVLFDEYNTPVGYAQLDKNGQNPEYFSYDDVVEFKWTDLGAGVPGLGIVEPVYDISLIKLNLRDAYGESMHRLANPLVCGKVGARPNGEDPEGIDPNAALINQTNEMLRGVNSKSVIAHPYYVELYLLESKNTQGVQINEFVDEQITGLRIPKTMLRGDGEETNKSTASVLSSDFMSLIRNKQAVLQHLMESLFKFKLMVDKGVVKWVKDKSIDYVGGYWLKGDGDVGPIPKFRFKTTSKEELAGRVELLKMMQESGFITPTDEDERVLRDILEMPRSDEGVDRDDIDEVDSSIEETNSLISSLVTLPKQTNPTKLSDLLGDILCKSFDLGRKSKKSHAMHTHLKQKASEIVNAETKSIIAATLDESHIKADTTELNQTLKKSVKAAFKKEVERAYSLGKLAGKGVN